MTSTRSGGPPTASPEAPAVRIDAENESAWWGERPLSLTPRAFAVLVRLVEHAGRLVTKDDLLSTVWRDAVVSDAALTSCIRDLRRALGDSPETPRYIQTVHRRGFRFVGPIARPAAAVPMQGASRPGGGAPATPPLPDCADCWPKTTALVGREAPLARLHAALERAMHGQRQLVFVSGEAGIGKTSLVEAFVAEAGRDGALRVGRGQCVEHYGAGEAYLPVLEALGRLGRAAGGEPLAPILMRHAPTWLVQLPGLLGDGDVEAVQRRAQWSTRDRMLRELVEALDVLTRAAPLVLLLEDLHWSDSATIDLLGMLARRREPARLLVLGTYRPADAVAMPHAMLRVKHELQLHGHCDEVALELLGVAAVDECLSHRFPGHGFPAELARVLHRNTGGNPLFLVNTIDYLIGQGHLREVGGQWTLARPLDAIAPTVPETLWQLIEKQAERLTEDERALLRVACVAGVEFSAAVAVAGGIDPGEAELRCEALARRGQFIRAAGVAEWPDGTVAGRYAFIHTLYQQLFYGRVSVGQRVGLHLRAGARLERAYGARTGEIAGELAMHFEHGRDFERAARYRKQAGENALRQHAYREAADHTTRALDSLRSIPESPERSQEELAAHVMLGATLTATEGYGTPEVARTYARARELCEHVGDAAHLLPVLLGLGRFHQGRGEVEIASGLATRLQRIAGATRDVTVGLAAHYASGMMVFYRGEFDAALAHLERGIALYDRGQHSPDRSAAFRAGQDPGVSCLVYAAWALQLLGYPARAAARIAEALALARSLGHPFSVVYACHFAAGLHLFRRERDAVQALEDEALAYSTEHGFRLFPMIGAPHRGWLLAERARGEEGLAQMREGLAASRAIGFELRRPGSLALVAEVCQRIGQPDAGLSAVAEALATSEHTGQHYWDAELHRLKGILSIQAETAPGDGTGRRRSGRDRAEPADRRFAKPDPAGAGDAESCFLEAIRIARRQRAKSVELRAATSLSRWWASRGRSAEAHGLLAEIRNWFTEGRDTADLREASAVLDDLERATRPGRVDEG